jgi:hypothetical protein
MQKNKSSKKLVTLYIVIGVFGRLIPHPANFTPVTNLCLFSGSKLPKYIALPAMLILLAVSDVLLAYMQGHPIFSSWTLFTYTGFAAMVLLSSGLTSNPTFKRLLAYILGFTLGFWLWTNFGVWLTGYYPQTAMGLLSCYLAALPFLRNALLGNLVWMVIIWGSFAKIKQLQHCEG